MSTEGDRPVPRRDLMPPSRLLKQFLFAAALLALSDLPADWIDRQDSSQWISIADDTIAPAGTYRYEMKFDLTGFDPASASIGGMWGVDSAGAQIYLNGKPTGIVNNVGPGEYTPFTIDRGFAAGVNSIEFVVPNEGSGAVRAKPGDGGDDPDVSLSTGLRMQLTSVSAGAATTDLATDTKLAHLFDLLGSTPAHAAEQ